MKRRRDHFQYVMIFLIVLSFLIVSFPVSAFTMKVRETETHFIQEIEDFVKNCYESKFKNKKASGEMAKSIVSNKRVLYRKGYQESSSKKKEQIE